MKKILMSIVLMQAFTMNLASAKTTDSVEATFNPLRSSSACSQLILGNRAMDFIQFENDGTVKVQLDIITNQKHQRDRAELLVNKKAYINFFALNKKPIKYENGPRMVKVTQMKEYLPSFSSNNKWGLIGYGLAYERTFVEKQTANNYMYVKELLQSADSPDRPETIRSVRTSELEVNSKEIILKITQEFDDRDPEIRPFYKKKAGWVRDLFCVMQR